MKKLVLIFTLLSTVAFPFPPEKVPEDLYQAYTDQGQTPIIYRYFDDSMSSKGVNTYTKKRVNKLIKRAKRKKANYYGKTDTWLYELLDKNPRLIKGKTVAIMGSVEPWYEAVVLAYGGRPYTNRIQ